MDTSLPTKMAQYLKRQEKCLILRIGVARCLITKETQVMKSGHGVAKYLQKYAKDLMLVANYCFIK